MTGSQEDVDSAIRADDPSVRGGDAARRRRPTLRPMLRPMLGCCALIGLVMAAAGALRPAGWLAARLAGRPAAWVNDVPIARATVDDAVERLVGRPGAPPTAELRAEVLERLIDEELLVQRAGDIGLLDSDRLLRKAVAMAMIDRVVADAATEEPEERELRRFYESNRERFTVPERLRVAAIYFRERADGNHPRERAHGAYEAIAAGTPFAIAAARYGDSPPAPLPDSMLPPHVISRYLGPDLAGHALAMAPGEISRPIAADGGLYLLRLVDAEPGRVRAFEAVAEQVRGEYLRYLHDRALRRYLDRRRARSEVTVVQHVVAATGAAAAPPTTSPRGGADR